MNVVDILRQVPPPKAESVVLASAGFEPVRIDDMTLEQAKEAIQVLAEENLTLHRNALRRYNP